MIANVRLDPHVAGPTQLKQYDDVSRAVLALALALVESGYDVVVTDVFYASDVSRLWRGLLEGVSYRAVRLQCDLSVTLARAASRRKSVQEDWVRQQHGSPPPLGWPVLDTSALTVEESATALCDLLARLE